MAEGKSTVTNLLTLVECFERNGPVDSVSTDSRSVCQSSSWNLSNNTNSCKCYSVFIIFIICIWIKYIQSYKVKNWYSAFAWEY